MPRLRIMTLNLWGYRGNWSARRARLIAAMQAEEVDVVLLQEVAERPWRANQAVEIAYLTGYAAAYLPAQRYFPWPPVSNGLGILSRFPVSNMLETELVGAGALFPVAASERRIAQRVEISLDGMSVVIYNTHFPLTREARKAAAYRLWKQIAQEEAVLLIVGGDFNAAPLEDPIAFLQGRIHLDNLRGDLVDAWATAGVGPAETFPIEQPRARIDYIFYQAEPSVIVQETRVIGLPPATLSDHAGVLATFSISPSRDQEDPFEEEPVATMEPTGGGAGGGFMGGF